MTYRIITHANCTDGFCSAFVFKKYSKYLTNLKEEDINQAEIITLFPRDVQTPDLFQFTDKDIVLDLPKPNTKIFFWADHHSSNKQEKPSEEDHWKIVPSNTGLLLELAEKNGLELTKELKEFKKAIDTIDDADYSKQDILDCYYPTKITTSLQKLHQIGSLFHTKDHVLNNVIFTTLLQQELGETPLTTNWEISPEILHASQLRNYQEWRDHVDEYLELINNTTVQDDRLTTFTKGVADRFYVFIKYPEASYSLTIKPLDDNLLRIGIGSNIFHKDRCKVDIGKLCKEIGKKFGDGSGGGHYYVGGATIFIENGDKAKEFILESLQAS